MYKYLGCYYDMLGPYLIADLQRNLPARVEGRNDLSVEECAGATRARGYAVFALQWTGQCYMGSIEDVARMDGVSLKRSDDMCVNVPCVISGSPCSGYLNKTFLLDGVRAPAQGVEV